MWNLIMFNFRNEVEDLMMVGVQIYFVGVWVDELNMRMFFDIIFSLDNFFNVEFFGNFLV